MGVGGSGKASLARFAARVSGVNFTSVDVRRGYGLAAFREDVKRAYKVGDVEVARHQRHVLVLLHMGAWVRAPTWRHLWSQHAHSCW